jgi:phage terminase large subunit-like protein
LGRELFEWQKLALDRAWQHDEDFNFVHNKALISCARQNGKTTMNAAIVGWALTVLPKIWGRPVTILSAAHELSLASEVFEELRELLELWEESGLVKKITWAYGRHEVRMLDGSKWKITAATSKKHGGSWSILLLDEIWSISESSIFGALLPSQIAMQSPMCWMTSTAGDESSVAFIKFREQALGCIDSNTPSDLFMAEWSLPPGVDPEDERYFGFSNPSLGKTITLKGLRSAAAAPNRSEFLRAHCNLWVSAAQSWMPHGMWEKRKTDWVQAEGGVLCVDSASDGSKYVAVWARPDAEGHVVVSMAFTTESNYDMWHEITSRLDQDPKLKLAITPGLYVHTPEKYRLRTTQWGYGEILKFVGLVRNFIIEGRILHTGETMLAEHVNRAVLVKSADNSIVISSQRSPGPIEAARCMVVAAALVSAKPASAKPSMGSSNR